MKALSDESPREPYIKIYVDQRPLIIEGWTGGDDPVLMDLSDAGHPIASLIHQLQQQFQLVSSEMAREFQRSLSNNISA